MLMQHESRHYPTEHRTSYMPDLTILLSIFALIGISLFVLYGADESGRLFRLQSIRFSVGLLAMFVCFLLPLHWLKGMIVPFYILTLLLLLGVLITGHTAGGAQRWLNWAGLRIQPSELAKISLPMILALVLAKQTIPLSWKSVLFALALIAVPAVLIIKQPDLGTAILVSAAGFFALYFAGLSWYFMLFSAAAMTILAPIYWHFFMLDYQKERVFVFWNAEADPFDKGYHIIQSKIAIGSGGISGKGWMHGTQSQFEFLPESNTDFIFAVIAEELGFFGVLLLLFLYGLILLRGLYLSSLSEHSFVRILCGSMCMTFFIYIFINIAMVSGMLPVVGLPLPLISYGGSSIVSLLVALGLVLNLVSLKGGKHE